MQVNGRSWRSIWCEGEHVFAIDQTQLPHRFEVFEMCTLEDAVRAISDMRVRGAPLIGVTAAYGLALAIRENEEAFRDEVLAGAVENAAAQLSATRPTAVNLRGAVERAKKAILNAACQGTPPLKAAFSFAAQTADEDVSANRSLGEHGQTLFQRAHTNVLTHCNAGWLATVDFGTALAPVFLAHARGRSVHVWVSETRPRNQGAQLTAWELNAADIPCTVVTDNACGWLMQHGMVDVCIVGTDRTTARGDVCNKIGTYLKALAAQAIGVPFYAAVPTSSIDWQIDDWREIPIEERSEDEVHFVQGMTAGGVAKVRVTPEGTRAKNPAFDVTPAHLVTGLITERGICTPGELQALFA